MLPGFSKSCLSLSLVRWIVFLSAVASARAAPRLILSEAMADPVAVADARGEFLELANVEADSLRLDSLVLKIDSARFVLPAVTIAPDGLFLICRDSLSIENGGMACGRQLPGLSLANGRALAVTLTGAGESSGYRVPASRPGISWENTMEAAGGFQSFLASSGPWAGGDSATPGFRNSRSVEPARTDLGITKVTWGADGGLAVEVKNLGTGLPPQSTLTVRLDEDWDGVAETPLDSVPVPPLSTNGTAMIPVPARPGLRGLVQARLSHDENPGDDLYVLPVDPGRPLAISEWCPAPAAGAPEWVEIRNGTADSGGQGRALSLTQLAFNDRPLGSRAGELAPGEYLLLVESAAKFQASYGAIKARLLEPPSWPGLRNTGDTLRISVSGFPLDSVAYGPKASDGGGGCLMRGREGLVETVGTPGFAEATVDAFAWDLSGRVVGPGRPLDISVNAPSGFHYALRVFDLEGDCVRDLGRGAPGRNRHRWSGEGPGGGMSPPGPYLLCLSADGHRARRIAIVVTDRR